MNKTDRIKTNNPTIAVQKKFYDFAQNDRPFCPNSSIISPKKFYHFHRKVLSFSPKSSTIFGDPIERSR